MDLIVWMNGKTTSIIWHWNVSIRWKVCHTVRDIHYRHMCEFHSLYVRCCPYMVIITPYIEIISVYTRIKFLNFNLIPKLPAENISSHLYRRICFQNFERVVEGNFKTPKKTCFYFLGILTLISRIIIIVFFLTLLLLLMCASGLVIACETKWLRWCVKNF